VSTPVFSSRRCGNGGKVNVATFEEGGRRCHQFHHLSWLQNRSSLKDLFMNNAPSCYPAWRWFAQAAASHRTFSRDSYVIVRDKYDSYFYKSTSS
jgi:hypothetical protein